MPGKGRGVYSIGVVSQLTGLHEQTIRQYERLGLIEPQRSAGGTRQFSQEDVDRLNSISSLTRELGVNLAGVDVILQMRDRQDRLMQLMREMFGLLDERSRRRFEYLLRGDEPGLVPVKRQWLARAGGSDSDSGKQQGHRRKIEIEDESE